MVSFQKKSLPAPKRVCLRLKEAREAQKKSLEEISLVTKISKKHLQALEDCRFSDIPYAPIYQKNFIRKYVLALHIEADSYLNQFIAEETTPEQIPETSVPIIKHSWLSFMPYVLRYVIVGVVLLVIFSYLGLQIKSIIDPPVLSLYSPEDGLITGNQLLVVQGKTTEEANVTINGQTVNTDTNGVFKEQINLANGINTFVISAKKKYGKTTETTRHVVYKENKHFSYLSL